MKILLPAIAVTLLAWSFSSCTSSSAPASFCDTCLKDSLKFEGDHPLRPYVYITAKDCRPDSIGWNFEEYGSGKKSSFEDLIGMPVSIHKEQFTCVFQDTSYAWLVFSDCFSSRGIQVHLPLTLSGKLNIRRSGINSFDPKFSIDKGLIAYSDGGNIFVEELTTGKKATMTFGQDIGTNFDAVHETIDSVSVTPTHVWAKVKIGNDWKELQKNIELK